jgi:hypothetical protein
MIRHKHLIAKTIVLLAVVLTACDSQQSSSTGPTISDGGRTSVNDESGSPSAASFPRSGAVHLIKDCTLYTGLAGSFCTITASNIPEIEVGSIVVYASAATPTSVDSDMILDPPKPGNNAASGHVIVDRVAGRSDITFSGGTGKFTHFSASIVGTRLPGRIWALDGTYSFMP